MKKEDQEKCNEGTGFGAYIILGMWDRRVVYLYIQSKDATAQK